MLLHTLQTRAPKPPRFHCARTLLAWVPCVCVCVCLSVFLCLCDAVSPCCLLCTLSHYHVILHCRYRGPIRDGGSRSSAGDGIGSGPLGGGEEGATTAASLSASSQLLLGERVMVAGVTDPPPEVSERLAKAAGAEVRNGIDILFKSDQTKTSINLNVLV